MADPEHLAILKQGVEAWNAWRSKNSEVEPDLTRANLANSDLKNANLSNADLGWALLNSVKMSGADLAGAKLYGHMIGADLRQADLRGCVANWLELTYGDLREANLEEAAMARVNFTQADLRGANLRGTILLETVFGDTDLRNAEHLGLCVFHRPCPLDIRTIAKSWPLPLKFLRGCGLSDEYIEYLPSLLNKPVQFYSLFISYSSADDDFAKRLHADLQDNGVRCWFAPENMKIGDKILDRIDQTIRVHDKLLVILSGASISSEWVEDEVTTAFEEERKRNTTVLFPIRLDDGVMDSTEPWAAKVRQRHIGDFTKWKNHGSYKKAFERLLRDLKAE